MIMLENTFIHIDGIGPKTEKRIWETGIRTWHHYLESVSPPFPPGRDERVRKELLSSLRHRNDPAFFRDRLPPGDMWRLFDVYKDRAVYLDIETSGGYGGLDEITVIGLFDGRRVETFVNGINLNEFEIAVAEFSVVITFNGAAFDLPYIRRWFPHISLPPAHIDLRFLLGKLGHRGGLKRIERSLGLLREEEIQGMDGFEAVMLWKAHQWGDRDALPRLIRYNTADIVNLQPLMEWGYQEMKGRLLDRPDELPCAADP
jgi:uncharacterized protein